ncbi:MAG: hypothetical protein ACLPKB_04170 [Xanthobacteraceae bacterium]
MELLITIIIGVVIVEVYAWLPNFSDWLIERSVRHVCREDQNRCREEWKAGLDDLPNTVLRLVHALSYIGAPRRINIDFFGAKLTEIDALIDEYAHKHSSIVASLSLSKAELSRLHMRLRQVKGDHLTALQIALASAKITDSSSQTLTKAAEDFLNVFVNKADRSMQLLTIFIEASTQKLTHIQRLIERASKQRDGVTGLLGRRGVSPDMLDTLVSGLANDLDAVKEIFEDNKWGDADLLRESNRIADGINDMTRAAFLELHAVAKDAMASPN